MLIEPLINAKAELLDGGTPPGPIVLSSRIRLARNLANFPFPGWAKTAQRREVLSLLCEVLRSTDVMKGGTVLNISELTEFEKQVLVERHLMSRELSSASDGAGVVISADQGCAVMINEEDHLRIQVLRSGFRLRDIWRVIDELDTSIESHVAYAFSPELGYLTACPTNVGTGIRASVMMHLPGLVLVSQMDKVIRAVNQLGIAVRGVLGEGSEASGSVFQISNQQTLGESEEDIIRRLEGVLKSIIDHENNARQRLLEKNINKILDKIGRSYGTLQNGHVITSAEAMNMLSLMRLAIDFGMLPEEHRTMVDKLFIESQPGHVQLSGKGTLDADKRDAARAGLIRRHFVALPPLDFDKAHIRA